LPNVFIFNFIAMSICKDDQMALLVACHFTAELFSFSLFNLFTANKICYGMIRSISH